MQIENKGASFSHLGTHVASILEDYFRKSSENMLADVAERAQEAIDAAEEEAAEIIKAAEHRAGEIEGEAQWTLEQARPRDAGRRGRPGGRRGDAGPGRAGRQGGAGGGPRRHRHDLAGGRARADRGRGRDHPAETLRTGCWEQPDGSTSTWSRCWTRSAPASAGSRRSREDLDEATAAAAARLGVEPPASSPEESPRFPSARDIEHCDHAGGGAAVGHPAQRPGARHRHGDARVGSLPTVADGRAEQPALSDTDDSPAGDAEATQPVLGDATTETTEPGDKTETIQPLAEDGSSDTANGEG